MFVDRVLRHGSYPAGGGWDVAYRHHHCSLLGINEMKGEGRGGRVMRNG